MVDRYNYNDYPVEMVKEDDGDYVKYDDYKKLLERIKTVMEEHERLADHCLANKCYGGFGMIDIKLYEKAIIHFGKTAQLKKWIEELDELKVEIQRFIDGEGDIDTLIQELADVFNMDTQGCVMLGISQEEIEKNMELKMLRTSRYIDSGYYK